MSTTQNRKQLEAKKAQETIQDTQKGASGSINWGGQKVHPLEIKDTLNLKEQCQEDNGSPLTESEIPLDRLKKEEMANIVMNLALKDRYIMEEIEDFKEHGGGDVEPPITPAQLEEFLGRQRISVVARILEEGLRHITHGKAVQIIDSILTKGEICHVCEVIKETGGIM
jgi:hypothetical protein